jgi:hypothetical protein
MHFVHQDLIEATDANVGKSIPKFRWIAWRVFFLFSFDDDGIGLHGELETLAGRSISINILES